MSMKRQWKQVVSQKYMYEKVTGIYGEYNTKRTYVLQRKAKIINEIRRSKG